MAALEMVPEAASDRRSVSVAAHGAEESAVGATLRTVEYVESRVRVIVLADVRLHREGIARILSADPQIHLVTTASPDRISVAEIVEAHTDVVLLEAAAVCQTAIVATLATIAPEIRIIAYAVGDGARQALHCAERGVAAFVMGNAGSEDLIAVILGAVRDEFQCPPQVASMLLRRVCDLARDIEIEPLRGLTPREANIAALIEQGLSNKEIARRLKIELSTAKNHVHSILEKLQATRRGQVGTQLRRLGRHAVGAIGI